MNSTRNRGLVTDSLLNLGGHVIPMLIALVSIPFILSDYRLEEFGLLSLSWTFLGSFAAFDLGMGRATVQAIARLLVEGEEDNIRGVVWGSLIASVGSGAAGAIVVLLGAPILVTSIFAISPDWSAEAIAVFSITGLAFPLVTTTSVLRGVLEAIQRFDVVNAIKAPANSLVFLIPLIGIFFSWDVPTIVLVTVFSRFFALLAYVAAIKRFAGFAVSFSNVSFSGFARVLKFGGWVTLTNAFTPVIAFSDRLILAALVPLEHVAFYTAPYELISRLPVLASSIGQGLFPILSQGAISDKSAKATDLVIRVVKTLLVVMAPVAVLVIAFSSEGLEYWLGEGWGDRSSLILQLLAAGFFFNSLSYVYLAAVHGAGRADLKAKLDLVVAISTLLLCWTFIRLWGVGGAAAARVILLAADFLLLIFFTKKISGLSWGGILPAELTNGLIACFAALIVAWVLDVVFTDGGMRASAVLILLVILSWFSWRYVARPEERVMIQTLMNKFAFRHPR